MTSIKWYILVFYDLLSIFHHLIFSPTKPPSKLEMLGNVKNQMSSWLGSGISGLRKNDSEVVPDPPAELLQETTKENFKEKEDDNSRSVKQFIVPLIQLY